VTSEPDSSKSSGLASQSAKAEGKAAAARDACAELTEDQALAMLQRPDVSADALTKLARNPTALKSRKVVQAVVTHPRTPRHISIPLLRRMFTFDLMQLALTPAVAADIKRAAEEQVLVRAESLSAGETISLARRGPGRIASELLNENDPRVVSVALDNGRLVEAGVVTALMKNDASQILFNLVSGHPKWSQRCEVQLTLLRSEKTPLERAREFATHFPQKKLEEILPDCRKADLMEVRHDDQGGSE
jgi:hypothetical protein